MYSLQLGVPAQTNPPRRSRTSDRRQCSQFPRRSGPVSRPDVADFLVKQIDDAALLHKTLALTG